MVLTGTEAIIYLYVLNDRTQKFEVNKVEYRKGEENYKIVNDNDNENEENQENQENQAEIQEPPQEEQNQPAEE